MRKPLERLEDGMRQPFAELRVWQAPDRCKATRCGISREHDWPLSSGSRGPPSRLLPSLEPLRMAAARSREARPPRQRTTG